MSTMTMSYNATNKIYTLEKIDVKELENFVSIEMFRVHI
jgi:hypothetical protein